MRDALCPLHILDQRIEVLCLGSQIGYGPGGLLHGICGLTRHVVDLNDREVDLFTGGRLLLTGRGNGMHLIRSGIHRRHDFLKGLTGQTGKIRCPTDLLHGVFSTGRTFFRALLNGLDGIAHVEGGSHRLFRQLAHLVSHHGKTAPGITGAGGFDGGIEGQQVGLVGNIGNDTHDPEYHGHVR